MYIRRSSSIGLILLTALMAAGMAVAGPPAGTGAVQEPSQRPPLTEEERNKIRQLMIEQMQKAEEAQKKATEAQQQRGVATQTPGAPAAGQPAAPPQSTTPTPVQRPPVSVNQVQLSYDNADLYDFINQIADTLGITPLVLDPDVKGNVTIHSSAPMSKEDVFPLFNLILKNNNAALVKQGNIYLIVPIQSGLKKGLEVVEHLPPSPPEKPKEGKETKEPERTPAAAPKPPGTQAPATGPSSSTPTTTPAAGGQAAPPATPAATQTTPPTPAPAPQALAPARQETRAPRLATHVIRVEFIPVRDLIDPLKLLMTDGGVIMPYDRQNLLIITDYTDAVQRILEIIRLLDSNYLNADLIDLIKVKYNNSADVVEDLRKIFGSGLKDSGTGLYFVSLDRQNAIFVMANSKRALEEIKRWIEKLDATSGRSVQTYVYTVENSTASNIAAIISALLAGEGAPGGTTGAPAGGARAAAGQTATGTTGAGGTSGGAFTTATSTGMFGGVGGGGGAGGAGAFGGGSQLGPRLSTAGGVSAQILRGGAFTGLQDTIRLVVDEINNSLIIQATAADYAYILEVIKKLDVLPRQVLIDARIFEVDVTDNLTIGVTADLASRAAGAHDTTAKLSSTGNISLNTFAFIGNSREILLALQHLREKAKVKVLEAPSILALDGSEAKIVVGGEVPYRGGSIVSTVATTNSIQYRETGVSLIVIPRISASGTVTLALAQEVSSVGVNTPELGPTFNKTSISTNMAVRDGETVVIAGLIRDNYDVSRAGVPWLNDIPLLGSLFGQSKRNIKRTEILILITPHVIRTPERFQEMTQDLKDSLRNVRKLVDAKEEEHFRDMQDAQEERIRRQERMQKRAEPPAAKNPKD